MKPFNKLAVVIPTICPNPGAPNACSPTISGFQNLYVNVITVFLEIGGIILFIMLLVGGFQYLTSGGDPKGTETARKTITYAIGGFVLLVLSFLIIKLIEVFTGAPVTTFTVTQ